MVPGSPGQPHSPTALPSVSTEGRPFLELHTWGKAVSIWVCLTLRPFENKHSRYREIVVGLSSTVWTDHSVFVCLPSDERVHYVRFEDIAMVVCAMSGLRA